MKNTIENENLSITIKNHGAELCSLKTIDDNKEYLWQADPKYWGKHSPILFPIIGCLRDNKYTYDGDTYNLTRHGFARDFEFKLIEKNTESIVYLLESSDETLQKYPFKFELYVKYTLKGNSLDISYEVKNKEEKEMYFSLGAHPAFNCNIEEGDKYIEFEEKETLDSYRINVKNGLIEKEKKAIIKNEKDILLTYDLFKDDALVFDNIKSDSLCVTDRKTGEKIKITSKGFPYLGVWTPNAPFICIEPWYGIADSVDSNNILEDKIGIQKLDAGEIFRCSYQIEIVK